MYPECTSRNGIRDCDSRGVGCVLDQLLGLSHQLTCCRVRVTEGNGRNEGTVPFIPSEGYRALHSGRKALIG